MVYIGENFQGRKSMWFSGCQIFKSTAIVDVRMNTQDNSFLSTPDMHATSIQITRWNQKLNTLKEHLFTYVDSFMSFKIKHQK